MTDSTNSFFQQDKLDSLHSFAAWQSKAQESVDEYTIRKRKSELYALVRKVIKNELDEAQQEIVRLHWYEEKSASEIATELGLDRSSVSRRLKKINEIIYDKLKYAMEYRYGKEFSEKADVIIRTNKTACCPIDGENISKRIRDLRTRQSLTVEELEGSTGISSQRLSLVEMKGEKITALELKKLCLFYGTTSDFIIFGNKFSDSGGRLNEFKS